MNTQPPKDGLVRAMAPGLELRDAEEGKMPKLTGYMLRFNEPTEIDSAFEGHFFETVASGATKKTLAERAAQIKILFNHGHDPSIGEKSLAEPALLEDSNGVRYDEPELFDTSYNRDLIPGLKAGQYGSSFRFGVTSEQFDRNPGKSDHNPDGIPERTITEMKLYEGGPVTFPAYAGAMAGARSRSLTDAMFIAALRQDPTRYPELEELFRGWLKHDPERIRGLLTEFEQEPAEEEAEVTSDDSGSNSEQHSPGAEQEPHSKAGRVKQSKYRTLAEPDPPWKLGREKE